MNKQMIPDKTIKLCITTIVLSGLLFSSGCGPTYTKENYLAALKDMCREEYGIDVAVKRVGNTTGIHLLLDGLFETETKLTGEKVNIEEVLGGIKFKKEAAKKIDHTSLSISRIALSADTPTDFYLLIATDKNTGIQIVVTRYVSDIRRLMLGDISRGDYFKRLLMDVEFNPSVFAQESVRGLFYDMQTKPSKAILGKYFTQGAIIRQFSSSFFLSLNELDNKQEKKYEVLDIKSKRISANRVLVYCKVREDYTPGEEHKNFKFQYPSGFENEYLIVVDTFYFPYLIERIVPLVHIDENGYTARSFIGEDLAKYGRPRDWDPEYFYVEDIQLTDFLAKQLAVRIRNHYQSDSRAAREFNLGLARCDYQEKEKVFSIIVDLKSRKGAAGSEAGLEKIWTIICNVMRRYEFEDFRGVEIRNVAQGETMFLTKSEIMDRFWPKWLRRKKRGEQ